jgi:hypothetical protein
MGIEIPGGVTTESIPFLSFLFPLCWLAVYVN